MSALSSMSGGPVMISKPIQFHKGISLEVPPHLRTQGLATDIMNDRVPLGVDLADPNHKFYLRTQMLRCSDEDKSTATNYTPYTWGRTEHPDFRI